MGEKGGSATFKTKKTNPFIPEYFYWCTYESLLSDIFFVRGQNIDISMAAAAWAETQQREVR